MKEHSRSGKWFTAIMLFVGFILTFFLDLTGLALHQWIGVLVALLAARHLWVHRGWVRSVTRRLSSPKGGRARLFCGVDAGLLLGLAAITLSGLAISTWIDASLGTRDAWVRLHGIASVLTLVLVVVKIGLHWRWLVATTRGMLSPASRGALAESADAPQPAPTLRPARREMLGLMGVVCLAAVVGGASALNGLLVHAEAQLEPQSASAVGAAAATRTPSAVSVSLPGSTSSRSSTCTIRCNKGCSYPGRCRRYTDTNGNKRCDLGECV